MKYNLKLGKPKISYNSLRKMIDNLPDEKQVKKKPTKSQHELELKLEKIRTEHIWEII